MTKPRKITHTTWCLLGGLKNTNLFRKQAANGRWTYWIAE